MSGKRRSWKLLWMAWAMVTVAAWALPPAAAAQDKASTLDSAKAKAFIGEWVLTIQGGRGAQDRPLSIKDVGGKVAAELGGGRGAPTPITDISMTGNDLVLKFQQGGRNGNVDVTMTLTITADGLTVKQDAGGQATTGTGKKK